MNALKIILKFFVLVAFTPFAFGGGTNQIEDLQSEIEETTDQLEKAYLLRQLGIKYQVEGNEEKAMVVFQDLIRIARKVENRRLEDFALQELGGLYLNKEMTNSQDESMGGWMILMGILLLGGGMYWSNSRSKQKDAAIKDQEESIKRYRETIEALNQKFQASTQKLIEEKEALNDQKKELETANEELKKFAYMATHDLKEPLRTIGSYAGLINRRYKDTFDEDGKQFLSFISDGVQRMHRLLSDVLNYAGLDSNTPEMEMVDTKSLVEELKQSLKSQFDEKNGKLIINELPAIMADKTHIHQIFQNLVSNGLKYNDKEHPIVLVDCKEENGFYIFGVHDNGIGLDMEFKDRIFEVFQRLHGKEVFEGTGIGLAIVKKLIQYYGGEVWVESDKGQGSKFCFSFPISKDVFEMA